MFHKQSCIIYGQGFLSRTAIHEASYLCPHVYTGLSLEHGQQFLI